MKMDLSPNFTPRSQQLIVESKFLAVSLNHTEVTADHLLVSLLRSEGGFIPEFVKSFGLFELQSNADQSKRNPGRFEL